MRTSRPILIILLVLPALGPAWAQTTWHVDDDCTPPGAGTELDPFCTIQDGIDAAQDGDTVLVAPGTYTGDGNRDISLFGKAMTLKSSAGPSATIIDIQGSPSSIHRGFFLIHGETCQSIIEGFTIENGYLIGDTGGSGINGGGGGAGIYIRDSSPRIRRCLIRQNISATSGEPFVFDGMGAGIYIDTDSTAVIEDCMIRNNIAGAMGGAMRIFDENSNVSIRNCVIAGNSASARGGGIYNVFATTIVTNTLLFDNSTMYSGGGLHNENGTVRLSNCIIWGNEAGDAGSQFFAQGPGLSIEYSNLQDGLEGIGGCCNWQINWGEGNIDADPLFFDPDSEDYHLLHGSPCIDAGDNLAVPAGVTTDLDGGPRFLDVPDIPDTGNPDGINPIVDMGSYEYDPDDCNNNDTPDEQDIAEGTSQDCNGNGNGIPDECEPDCNENDQADSCDIAEGISEDCTGNGIPDECEPDCNENGQPDSCDIAEGLSEDCNSSGVPDECEPDCNGNGEVDACDILDGFSHDCDGDNIPDECDPGPPILEQPADAEVQAGDFVIFFVQADGALLFYQWRKDGVDLTDTDRIIGTTLATLFILDVRPLDAGAYDCVVTDLFGPICTTSEVATLTVITDCPADFDNTGGVGPFDLAILLGNWGPNPNHPADLNDDDIIDAADLALLLGNWGPCQ
ncbi:MAG: hypothetical protein O7D91_11765 [Planctomycetota bacterium]|nr:hypothetical protein [Planctomycetota bacterium]